MRWHRDRGLWGITRLKIPSVLAERNVEENRYMEKLGLRYTKLRIINLFKKLNIPCLLRGVKETFY